MRLPAPAARMITVASSAFGKSFMRIHAKLARGHLPWDSPVIQTVLLIVSCWEHLRASRYSIGWQLREKEMQQRSAVFDLDGTLADTADDLIDTANAILHLRGIPPLDHMDTRNAVGMGGRSLLRLGYLRAGKSISDVESETLYPEFIRHYLEYLDRRTRLFEGVQCTLQYLLDTGWQLGVCTNKPVAPAVELLNRLEVIGLFGVVLGGDSLHIRKPDPHHLLETLRRIGGDRECAVMVGDSRIDLATAQAANVPCVLMGYGYSPEPVAELGADRVAESFGELPQVFEELLPDLRLNKPSKSV